MQPVGVVKNPLTILTWNTGGLDPTELEERAFCLAACIIRNQPDVLLLQEVVAATMPIFDRRLGSTYNIKYGFLNEPDGYFTALGVRSEIGSLEYARFEPFPTSSMGRGLQVSEGMLYGVDVTIIHSHLESLKHFASERIHQMTRMLEVASAVPESHLCMFGGDLNLREEEIEKAGGLPNHFVDAWEELGCDEFTRWTWDLKRNDNLKFSGKRKNFTPRGRFDRIYTRCTPPAGVGVSLRPSSIELVGTEKITERQRFPSDHFGVVLHADLMSYTM